MVETGLNRINILVKQAMEGNGTAFTALWDLNIDSLRLYLKKWIPTLNDFYVEDICCRSFEKAFRMIGTYDPQKSQFVTWLRKIARNTTLDFLEKESKEHHLMISFEEVTHDDEILNGIAFPEETALETIIRSEDEVEREKYIERLPELYREVARLRVIDGMQYKEIAQELDMELNTVRTRIRRARTMMDAMREEDEKEL